MSKPKVSRLEDAQARMAPSSWGAHETELTGKGKKMNDKVLAIEENKINSGLPDAV